MEFEYNYEQLMNEVKSSVNLTFEEKKKKYQELRSLPKNNNFYKKENLKKYIVALFIAASIQESTNMDEEEMQYLINQWDNEIKKE